MRYTEKQIPIPLTLSLERVMSLDQARAYIEKMKSDETFRYRVMAIEDVAERFKLIKSEGFDCSEAEIKEVTGELSDKDLDKAVGGFPQFFN